ncbi:MAG: hypothetical protein PHH14_05745 [Candidatus Margulisbacteria bacterium]|nr:hypothetical protein [Candidatus Margulisiibacteriota bacterium]
MGGFISEQYSLITDYWSGVGRNLLPKKKPATTNPTGQNSPALQQPAAPPQICLGPKREEGQPWRPPRNLTGIINDAITEENPIRLDFQKRFGHADIEVIFVKVEDAMTFPAQEIARLRSENKTVFIKMEAVRTNDHYLDDLLNHKYDVFLQDFFEQAAANGIPIFFHKVGHEMNGRSRGAVESRMATMDWTKRGNVAFSINFWYPWGGLHENTPAEFAQAGKRYAEADEYVYNFALKTSAKNLIYIWSPHVIRDKRDEIDFTPYYPKNRTDLILFDVYCPLENQHCTTMTDWLADGINQMEKYFDAAGIPPEQRPTYGIGEWGAKNEYQLVSMLHFILTGEKISSAPGSYQIGPNGEIRALRLESGFKKPKKPISIEIYYNSNSIFATHRTPLLPEWTNIYRHFQETFTGGAQGFFTPEIEATFTSYSCPTAPTYPDNTQINRLFTPVDPLQLGLSADLPLVNYPAEASIPPLAPPLGMLEDLGVGYLFDRGEEDMIFDEHKLNKKLTLNELPLETLEKTLSAIISSQPFVILGDIMSILDINQNLVKQLNNIYPQLAGFFDKEPTFWKNVLILFRAYIQKAIENNDQASLHKSLQIGQAVRQMIIGNDNNGLPKPRSSYSPDNYEFGRFTLSLAEAYSLLEVAEPATYQTGITLAEEAIADLCPRSSDSSRDYYSAIKGVTIAADLHMKLSQKALLAGDQKKAKAELEVARDLYKAIVDLDYKKPSSRLEVHVPGSKISISASVGDILKALDTIKGVYLSEAETVAGKYGIFRLLRGVALLKYGSVVSENPFKPVTELGYNDVIQSISYFKTGLLEIAEGAPYADNRYMTSWGNLLLTRAVKSFSDTLAYATSNFSNSEAIGLYRTAFNLLQKTVPDLSKKEDWVKLEKLLVPGRENIIISPAMKAKMEAEYNFVVNYSERMFITKRNQYEDVRMVAEVATPTFLGQLKQLLTQTYTDQDFRINLSDELVRLSGRYFSVADKTLDLPHPIYKKADNLRSRAKSLNAQITLQRADNEIRLSSFIKFGPDQKILNIKRFDFLGSYYQVTVARSGGKIDADLPYINETLLPLVKTANNALLMTDYSRIDAAFTRATLLTTVAGNVGAERDLLNPLEQDVRRQLSKIEEVIPILNDPTVVNLIDKQPARNRDLLTLQRKLKLITAYIIKADALKKLKMDATTILDETFKLLTELKKWVDAAAAGSQPPLFDLHDVRAEIYQSLATVYALRLDPKIKEKEKFLWPRDQYINLGMMIYHLDLAKRENLLTHSKIGIEQRSFILSNFMIPTFEDE